MFCVVNTFERLVESKAKPDDKKKMTKEFFEVMKNVSIDDNIPDVAYLVQNKIKKIIGIDDIFKDEKLHHNEYALELYPRLKEIIEKSNDKFNTASKIAVAGNVIDLGPNNHTIDVTETINIVLNTNIAIDHSKQMEQDIKSAKNIMYLADNCGEVVFDKIFIETFNTDKVVFVTRGANILNDVTIEDAKFVGIDKIVKVISNGFSSPCTDLKRVSDEFKQYWNKADIVISKGMGNYEGLCNVKNKKIYFMLMAKCPVIAKELGIKQKDVIIISNI